MKYLILLLALLAPSIAQADTHVYYFDMPNCVWCPVAKAIIVQPDIKELVVQYDDNYEIDIVEHQDWKRYYKVNSVPLVLIVDVDGDKRTVLARWQLNRSQDQGKSILKSALQKFLPKKKLTSRVPFLKGPND